MALSYAKSHSKEVLAEKCIKIKEIGLGGVPRASVGSANGIDDTFAVSISLFNDLFLKKVLLEIVGPAIIMNY